MFGEEGHDDLMAGRGNDELFGEEGNDRLRGESGNDALFGGDGRDRLYDGKGNASKPHAASAAMQIRLCFFAGTMPPLKLVNFLPRWH